MQVISSGIQVVALMASARCVYGGLLLDGYSVLPCDASQNAYEFGCPHKLAILLGVPQSVRVENGYILRNFRYKGRLDINSCDSGVPQMPTNIVRYLILSVLDPAGDVSVI